MRMHRGLLLVLLAVLFLILTGCWDRRELSDLGITMAMGIDKAGNKYQVTVQVVQPGEVATKKGGGQGLPVTTYKAKGVTVYEAIRKITTDSPRKIYAAHLRMVIFGEKLAREGIGNTIDLLSRDYELRTDFYIVVAKETTAANVLRILTPLETTPAEKIYKSLEISSKVWAPSTAMTLDEFIKDYGSEGKQPVLSGIELIGDAATGNTKKNVETIQPAAILRNTGLAVLRKDKLLGWLNEEESKGYNYIANQVKNTVGHVVCPNGKGNIALEVVASKAKIKGFVHNGTPSIHINLYTEQSVGDVECRVDLTLTKTVEALEREAQKELREIITRSIRTVQSNYQADIFGFGDVIHRSNPKAWKSLKGDWNRHFTDLDVQVNVKVKIKRVGTINQSFLKKEEEEEKE